MKKVIPFMIWLIATALGYTWRFRITSPPAVDIFDAKAAPKIYCFWHSTLLVVSYMFRHTGKTAIVSQSKDGLIAADVAGRWGHEAVFGSSRRGGAAALRQSVKAIRAGRSLGITPDGPKGPAGIAKPGAAQIAIVSKTPLVTIKVETKSAWRLKSWDRFMIPKPFAKIFVTLSKPIDPENISYENSGISKINSYESDGISEINSYESGGIHDDGRNQSEAESKPDKGDALGILTNILQEALS